MNCLHTIWAKILRDRVGLATMTQSTLGISAPSVRIAVNSPLLVKLDKAVPSCSPQFRRTGNSPALNEAIKALRSAAGVPEWIYAAFTPTERKALVNSPTCARFTQKTNVDFLSAGGDCQRIRL